MTIFKAAWWIILYFLNCKRNVNPLVICLTYNPVILKNKTRTNSKIRHKINEGVRIKTSSGARFSKPSEHDYLMMVLRSRIGSTSECFPKHQTVHRKIIVCCPAQVHRILCDIHR